MKKLLLLLSLFTFIASSSAETFTDIPSNNFEPDGWVSEFLNRQESGLTGHPEQSGYPFNRGGWVNGLPMSERECEGGKSWFPYEQAAYYLDGALRCGYMANNAAMMRVTRENIDYVLSLADGDGQIRLRDIEDDWWPLVVFFRLITEEYENTHDERLLNAMVRHYKATYSDGKGSNFVFKGFSSRSLLHVEHLCKLYEYTSDKWFIEMAEELYAKFEAPHKKPISITAQGMNAGVQPSGHAVTYHEFLKLPAVLYYYTGKRHYLTAFQSAIKMLEEDHELADGLTSAIEFIQGQDSHMGHELCNSIDLNWSCGWALLATGDAHYADKVERSLYNVGFPSVTSDFRAHQYYGSPNTAIITTQSCEYHNNTNWGIAGKKRYCYRPGHDTECCSGNLHRMLPTFINRSMMVGKGGIHVNYYIPGRTKLEWQGVDVEIAQESNYPIEFSSSLEIVRAHTKAMELSLRIPGWATSYTIMVNGESFRTASSSAAHYETIKRKFTKGDKVSITFETAPRFCETGAGGVAVNYGPLLYAFEIESFATKMVSDRGNKCSEEFPSYEFYPQNHLDWAYAINPAAGAKVVRGENSASDYPWERSRSYNAIEVEAQAVKNWPIREWCFTEPYPATPELSGERVTLRLIPIANTYLRIADFPIIR